MPTEESCRHEWGAAELALDGDSGDAIDVCLRCGQLRYHRGDGSSDAAPLDT